MVEFVTLFLGALVVGPARVELQVHEDVAAVEIRLDSRAVATLRAAPWELEVDLGAELLPHVLEAVALDADGGEVGRARQWINLSPRAAEVAIGLDRDSSNGRVVARVTWQTLSADNQPVDASAAFDGAPLEVLDPAAIPLPPHDPDRLHHLRVELEFRGGLHAEAEVTFGGQYGDSVSSELTALAVRLETLDELPAADAMQGWFRSRGQPLRVHSAEKGLAEIVVVRSPPARRRLLSQMSRRPRAPGFPRLRQDHRLRFLGAVPAPARTGAPFLVFPRSTEIGDRVASLLTILGSVNLPEGPSREVRLSDAVAVAGAHAHRSARRRVVVLIATGERPDASQFGPEQVRRYLDRLGVPLVVWNPVPGARQAGRWGPALNVSTDALLDQAYESLGRELDRQRIVWLSGLVLPQSVALDAGVEGVRRAR